jgi:hypothetical protein
MNNVKIEELKREEFTEALEILNEAAKSYKKVLLPEAYKEPAQKQATYIYKVSAKGFGKLFEQGNNMEGNLQWQLKEQRKPKKRRRKSLKKDTQTCFA